MIYGFTEYETYFTFQVRAKTMIQLKEEFGKNLASPHLCDMIIPGGFNSYMEKIFNYAHKHNNGMITIRIEKDQKEKKTTEEIINFYKTLKDPKTKPSDLPQKWGYIHDETTIGKLVDTRPNAKHKKTSWVITHPMIDSILLHGSTSLLKHKKNIFAFERKMLKI